MSNRTTKSTKTVLTLSVLFILSVVVPPCLAGAGEDAPRLRVTAHHQDDPVRDVEAGSLTKLTQAVLGALASATGVQALSPVFVFTAPTPDPVSELAGAGKEEGPTSLIDDANPI